MSNTEQKVDEKNLRLVEVFEEVFDDVEVRHAAHLLAMVPKEAGVSSMLRVATTLCLPIQQEIDASLCLDCDHFIGSQRMEDGSLMIRCWSHKARSRLARGTQTFKITKKTE